MRGVSTGGGGGGVGGAGVSNSRATYRERLGGYLHPRDMRRLVTPFSSSNEPQLIVRRHAMLLNFDPLRAIVLKDRLLVLVPDGADSILIALEGRVRGGVAEMTDQVFGGASEHDVPPVMMHNSYNKMRKTKSREVLDDSNTEGEDYSDVFPEDVGNDEWQDIQRMDWQKLPFELQSVDAILQTVTSMLMEDVRSVHHRAERAMGELRGDAPNRKNGGGSGALTEYAQERLRLHKDEVNLMDRRVRGFVRAINQVLDEDEDMTLMNLSRLLTHPERFMQPVPQEVLEEESDEPELILETYLQQALSIVNTLDLLKGQIVTTQEQISMTLDALRNRLLFINTLLSLASLCVTIGAFIGSLFGMNITNPLQDTPDSTNFLKVVWVTSSSVAFLCGILAYIFYRVTNTPTFKYFPGSGNNIMTRAPSVQMFSSFSPHFHPH
jgi:magnesium transporter